MSPITIQSNANDLVEFFKSDQSAQHSLFMTVLSKGWGPHIFCGPSGSVNSTLNVSADKHIFKVGINYLFNPAAPVVAKY